MAISGDLLALEHELRRAQVMANRLFASMSRAAALIGGGPPANPCGLAVSLAIGDNGIATSVTIAPTITLDFGIVTSQQYRVLQGGQEQHVFVADSGHKLDLSQWQGQTVDIEITVRARCGSGISSETAEVSVAVPSFTRVITLNDTGSGGDNYTTWASAIGALATGTLLEIHPHSSGTWSLVETDYLDVTGLTGFAVRGVGGAVIDGQKDIMTGARTDVLRLNSCTRVSITELEIVNPYFGGVFVDGSSSNIKFENTTVTDGYGRGIHLNGSSDVEFTACNCSRMLEIPGSFAGGFNRNGMGIACVGGTNTDVEIYRCTTTDNDDDGVMATGANNSGWKAIGHTSLRNGRQGLLFISGMTDFEVVNGEYRGNYATGIQIEGENVWANIGNDTTTKRGVVRGNLCVDNNEKRSEAGIWIDGSQDVLVEHNTCTNGNNGVIVGRVAQRVIVRHNCLHENNCDSVDRNVETSFGGFAVWLHGDIADVAVYNNSAPGNGALDANEAAASTNGAGVYSLNDTATCSNVRFKNNVLPDLVLNTETVSNTFTVMMASGAGHITEWDHNIYDGSPRSNGYALSNSGGATNYDFADWQTASGLDANSSSVSDALVDASTCALEAGSPCLNAADSLTTVASGSTGTTLTVDDGTFFHPGDDIQIGSDVRKVVSKAGNVLTLATAVTVSASDRVYLNDYELGKVVNVGAK